MVVRNLEQQMEEEKTAALMRLEETKKEQIANLKSRAFGYP
jgi:hypothetical protein